MLTVAVIAGQALDLGEGISLRRHGPCPDLKARDHLRRLEAPTTLHAHRIFIVVKVIVASGAMLELSGFGHRGLSFPLWQDQSELACDALRFTLGEFSFLWHSGLY